jgi:translation initiation factor IF-3
LVWKQPKKYSRFWGGRIIKRYRVNRRIRAPQVRLIGADGKQIGVMPTQKALVIAGEHELDLVEIVATPPVPVCKIMDYGKFLYEESKKEKLAKKHQHSFQIKEIKLRPKIEDHDFLVKLKHARKFIDSGHKVKFVLKFRGREITHPKLGEDVLQRVVQQLSDISKIEQPVKRMGKLMIMVLSPSLTQKKEEHAEVEDQAGSGEAVQ